MFSSTNARRRVRLAIMSMALAAASVLAIAWGSAALLDYPSATKVRHGRGLSSSEWWIVHEYKTFGGTRYVSIVMVRAIEYEETPDLIDMPAWADLPQPVTTGSFWTNQHFEIVDSRGWPWRCLSFRFSGTGRGAARTGTVSGGFELAPFHTGAWYSPRAFPYTPIWIGLFGDLLIHWLVWFALFLCISEGRRAWRRRHHRCSACGHMLHGVPHKVCPECGEPVR